MIVHNLGYPRIGVGRELKKACEDYFRCASDQTTLIQTGKGLRSNAWQLQKAIGLDLIPSNDFSFYDQVLDVSVMVGAIPQRYASLQAQQTPMDLYFTMARGIQHGGLDITAMEMTKWFDTNYHYIVPEFTPNQSFALCSQKPVDEFLEAKALGILTKPVLISPVSYLLLGKGKGDRADMLNRLLPVYLEVLKKLAQEGATWIQMDEPFLCTDMDETVKPLMEQTYTLIRNTCPTLEIMVATYFEGLRENVAFATRLPVHALHIDLVRAPEQLTGVLAAYPTDKSLSLGVVDGRNIWKNDYEASLRLVQQAVGALGSERVMIAPSCSLLHVPCDLDVESKMSPEIKRWLAFAKQKVVEVVTLKHLAGGDKVADSFRLKREENRADVEDRKHSPLIHNPRVKERVDTLHQLNAQRQSPFSVRRVLQQKALGLPSFPTTTIGSFPQTSEVRSWRAKLKSGEWSQAQYDEHVADEIKRAIQRQEALGIDVLVHGEFERNDMVEYFGEQLSGYVFSQNGWVQSYGSRCVKPPIIYGDIARVAPMTVKWSVYAQSLTTRPVKGMLTGPITMLQWSFVRNDQPRATTALQLALAIRDEVSDLEAAGIRIIQIDEPALREGLPLREADRPAYLEWAVQSFRVSSSSVRDETQIHTHMCYCEFNDIIKQIAELDADVISIETSRSQMELLDAFTAFQYPNDIGPGVYDIHSPRVPSQTEMTALLNKAAALIPAAQLWVNPDCGLKTRGWAETEPALSAMVAAAAGLRK